MIVSLLFAKSTLQYFLFYIKYRTRDCKAYRTKTLLKYKVPLKKTQDKEDSISDDFELKLSIF